MLLLPLLKKNRLLEHGVGLRLEEIELRRHPHRPHMERIRRRPARKSRAQREGLKQRGWKCSEAEAKAANDGEGNHAVVARGDGKQREEQQRPEQGRQPLRTLQQAEEHWFRRRLHLHKTQVSCQQSKHPSRNQTLETVKGCGFEE